MNLTGDRIMQLPSCLRNTSPANDISANSIEQYKARFSMSRSALISSGVGARSGRGAKNEKPLRRLKRYRRRTVALLNAASAFIASVGPEHISKMNGVDAFAGSLLIRTR